MERALFNLRLPIVFDYSLLWERGHGFVENYNRPDLSVFVDIRVFVATKIANHA